MKEKEKKQYTHIIHPFPPLYDSESEILILGSFPSVKSREQKFFYGHKQNRFWKVMAAVLETAVPETIEEKKRCCTDIISHYGIVYTAVTLSVQATAVLKMLCQLISDRS